MQGNSQNIQIEKECKCAVIYEVMGSENMTDFSRRKFRGGSGNLV